MILLKLLLIPEVGFSGKWIVCKADESSFRLVSILTANTLKRALLKDTLS